MKLMKYELHPYPYVVVIAFDKDDLKRCNRYIKQFEDTQLTHERVFESVGMCWTSSQSTIFMIGIDYAHMQKHDYNISKMVATVTHECAHVALTMFKEIGHDVTEGQEPFCYLLDHLVQYVVQKLVEHHTKAVDNGLAN